MSEENAVEGIPEARKANVSDIILINALFEVNEEEAGSKRERVVIYILLSYYHSCSPSYLLACMHLLGVSYVCVQPQHFLVLTNIPTGK